MSWRLARASVRGVRLTQDDVEGSGSSAQTPPDRTGLVGQSGKVIEYLCNQLLAARVLRLGRDGKKLD